MEVLGVEGVSLCLEACVWVLTPIHPRFLLAPHTHSALARAMHTSLIQAKVNDKFQDSLFLFLELGESPLFSPHTSLHLPTHLPAHLALLHHSPSLTLPHPPSNTPTQSAPA